MPLDISVSFMKVVKKGYILSLTDFLDMQTKIQESFTTIYSSSD